ncbi:hypothetical protein [Streptomyces candidus]|uniref:Uncharacterized protein n=1 Tax=Streptomyces candidus TaxID=67283 RepID=A0A7X0HLD6_9ACTN|nr:hypothetical protein [Streptomyces candidus]MBB6439806.1 hypothetical protein [Streptomyces candidus]GHH57175.1 hypothetical protein GCM10018773_64170 [Streptomyces candidus]
MALGREHTPGGDFLRRFGPTTVIFKRAENASITQRPDEVLRLAALVPAAGQRATSNNLNRHLLDVANAEADVRNYAGAVDTLLRVETAAPQWLPNQRLAADILTKVISRRRTLTPDMRRLADVVRLPAQM